MDIYWGTVYYVDFNGLVLWGDVGRRCYEKRDLVQANSAIFPTQPNQNQSKRGLIMYMTPFVYDEHFPQWD